MTARTDCSMEFPDYAAMLLAAGRGSRMRPLTDHTPKPLLAVQGRALLDWHIAALLRDGVGQMVVNTGWLWQQIPAYLNAQWPASQVQLRYSHEVQDCGHALETAGGIARALPQLPAQFWLVAGDVFAPDFVFSPRAWADFAASTDLAHLWLVPNPPHHPHGDFACVDGRALNLPPEHPGPRWTYSTIALLKKELFTQPWCEIAPGNPDGIEAPLAPLLRCAMDAGRVGASLYAGRWTDVGTPERLAQLNGA